MTKAQAIEHWLVRGFCFALALVALIGMLSGCANPAALFGAAALLQGQSTSGSIKLFGQEVISVRAKLPAVHIPTPAISAEPDAP